MPAGGLPGIRFAASAHTPARLKVRQRHKPVSLCVGCRLLFSREETGWVIRRPTPSWLFTSASLSGETPSYHGILLLCCL